MLFLFGDHVIRVARWYIFKQNQNMGKFWRPCKIFYIWSFGQFSGHLVYFMALWLYFVVIGYIFTFWVNCTTIASGKPDHVMPLTCMKLGILFCLGRKKQQRNRPTSNTEPSLDYGLILLPLCTYILVLQPYSIRFSI
jgi:hypothetical protein